MGNNESNGAIPENIDCEVSKMSNMAFIKGLGIGMAAGMAVAFMATPKKKGGKSMAGKAIKALGDIVENVSDALGF